MKLSKKLIAAFSVAAMLVTAMSVTGCKKEDDDDPYEMITKVNSNYYTINHTNTVADTVQRGYKATHFQHAGALVDITFNSAKSTGSYGDGVMGIIFGLESNKDGTKNFYVLGLRNKGDYYISQYKNVKDLQGNNFGAETTVKTKTEFDAATGVVEYDISDGFKTVTSSNIKPTSDSVSYTVLYKDTVNETKNSDDTYTHAYKVYILNANNTSAYELKDNGVLKDGSGNDVDLSSETLVATIDYNTTSSSYTQRQFALYANVYPNESKCSSTYSKAKGKGSVKGYWKIQGDFKHADVVED